MFDKTEITAIYNVIISEFIKIEDFIIKNKLDFLEKEDKIQVVCYNSKGIKVFFKDVNNERGINNITWKEFIEYIDEKVDI